MSCAAGWCAGWFTSGSLLGGFGQEAQGGKVGPAAAAAAKTWALGVPLGVAIRSLGRGYVPAMSFIGIALGVTGGLMIGWRTALAAVTPEVCGERLGRRPGGGCGIVGCDDARLWWVWHHHAACYQFVSLT